MHRADESIEHLEGAFRIVLRDLEDNEGIRVRERIFERFGRLDGPLKMFQRMIGEDRR